MRNTHYDHAVIQSLLAHIDELQVDITDLKRRLEASLKAEQVACDVAAQTDLNQTADQTTF